MLYMFKCLKKLLKIETIQRIGGLKINHSEKLISFKFQCYYNMYGIKR